MEYEVTIKDGYAQFETNHFSVYTLAVKNTNKIENPSTIDNIKSNILIGTISIIGLVGTIIYFKKEFNN